MKPNRLWHSLVLTVLLFGIVFMFNRVIAQELPIFRIGVLDDTRGALANGAGLAVREINRAGGVIGADGSLYRLELIVETPSESETLADAIQRISEADVIAVIGPTTTEEVLTYLPQLQRLRVPVLTPAVGDTLIATDTSNLLFRIRAAERFQGRALAALLVNDLNLTQVTTVQLDRDSTGARVGFSVALSDLNPSIVENNFLLEEELPDLITEVLEGQPSLIVAFGSSAIAVDFYSGLRDAGWVGFFAYPQAGEPEFRDALPLDDTLGIIGTTTWPVTAVDTISTEFLIRYVRAFGQIPGALDAATYDAIQIIAEAIGEGGNFRDNLETVRDVQGVQGILNPSVGQAREMSQNVAVIQLNSLGGPETVARYAGVNRLPPDQPASVGGTPQPLPSPTPDGVFATIQSQRQNVRSGPGTNYDVLGQLQQGELRRVIGATTDFAWVVIEYRGLNGWLSASLLELSGDLSTLPIVTPPPTPTPLPATPTPPPTPFADLVIISASPPTITQGVLTNISVTVRNQGLLDAGPFAIAATFPPDSFYTAINLSGLPAGTQQTVLLPVQLGSATGNFVVGIIADLNNQVDEGPGGKANNTFNFTYKVDRQLLLINNAALGINNPIDLESNLVPQFDLQYTVNGLETLAPCAANANCVGVISPALSFDTAHYDALSTGNGVNQTVIPNAALTPGTIIGVLTAEGNRAVLRVDAVQPGASITLTWRVYVP